MEKARFSPDTFNVIAALILTSVLGIPFAGYGWKTAGVVFIIHSTTYACIKSDSLKQESKKDCRMSDEFDMI